MKQDLPARPILLVDDEEQFVKGAEMVLMSNGFNNIHTCTDPTKVIGMMRQKEYEMLILDVLMPNIPGNILLDSIIEEFPDIPVLMVTAVVDVNTAVECIKKGAYNYLIKPIDDKQFVSEVNNILEYRELKQENIRLRERLLNPVAAPSPAFVKYITKNAVMYNIFNYIEAIAQSNQPVLIYGETGVGKELIAESIHRSSQTSRNFVVVNVAGLDDNLFSDTLFGHKKGAFTGADKDRPGIIEQAENGTLFLDEIGDLGQVSQVKLLRLLQQQEYLPLGSDTVKKTSARFVFATNHDLKALQKEGRFRKDFYFRLKTHYIRIPPLRERNDDIPVLLSHFVNRAAEELGRPVPKISTELINLLEDYTFPGNIRELESMVYDALTYSQDSGLSIDSFRNAMDLDDEDHNVTSGNNIVSGIIRNADRFPTLKEACQILVMEALDRADNNQREAAEMLGITRQALNQRLKSIKNNNGN